MKGGCQDYSLVTQSVPVYLNHSARSPHNIYQVSILHKVLEVECSPLPHTVDIHTYKSNDLYTDEDYDGGN